MISDRLLHQKKDWEDQPDDISYYPYRVFQASSNGRIVSIRLPRDCQDRGVITIGNLFGSDTFEGAMVDLLSLADDVFHGKTFSRVEFREKYPKLKELK